MCIRDRDDVCPECGAEFMLTCPTCGAEVEPDALACPQCGAEFTFPCPSCGACLLYTSDAADERSSVDLGGRRIIKKKKINKRTVHRTDQKQHNITDQQQQREYHPTQTQLKTLLENK